MCGESCLKKHLFFFGGGGESGEGEGVGVQGVLADGFKILD